ncbi:MAG: hypothetical protein DBX49_01175 [Clostridia bacterium]|nr:MAG: hypothetical protein DBX49_01175 [Clostridia bacterium]
MNEILTAVLGGSVGAALITGIFGIIKWYMERKAQKNDKEDDVKTALRMLLYDRIKHLGKAYIQKGEISIENLEDLMQMHKVYHNNLNGNGFLDDLMETVRSLPRK